MPHLIFRLNGVPDDESADVRQLLDDADISYYETTSGRWGVSVAALWVRTDDEYRQARELIGQYQLERTGRVREEYANSKMSFLSALLNNPVESIMIVLAVVFILGLSIYPFVSW